VLLQIQNKLFPNPLPMLAKSRLQNQLMEDLKLS